MPYNYAHALTGFHALKNCKNLDVVGLPLHEDAFFLGTMGPDPYYGDAYLPPLIGGARTDLADRLHALDGRALFSQLLALSEGSAVRTAYTMGMLCHFLLDNRVHPYIEARFSGKTHTPAEIAMDLPLVSYFGETRLSVPPRAFYAPSHETVRAADELHAKLFSALFSLDTRGVYARSLHKWLRLNTFSFDPHGRKRRTLCLLPQLTRFLVTDRPQDACDRLNLTHTPWRAPDGTIRTESVPELFAAAMQECTALIDLALGGDTANVAAALKGRNADASAVV